MAIDLALLSQKPSQTNHHHPTHRSPIFAAAASMWNPKPPNQVEQEDDSWEVRAFAEDTGNAMGTTWPPRSYTCAFCRREFRSAQALGGHMNVHRRDRARLHQSHHQLESAINNLPATATSSSSNFLLQGQEFAANSAGLCVVYQLPNPNGVVFGPPRPVSVSNMVGSSHSPYFGVGPSSFNFPATFSGMLNSNFPSIHYNTKSEAPSASKDELINNNNDNNKICEEAGSSSSKEEVDLELRLGQKPKPPPP